MKVTVWPMLRDGIIKFFTDMQFFFKPDFIKENYHKHIGYSLVLTIPCILFMLNFMHLADTPTLFIIFIGGFGARAVNFVREGYLMDKYGSRFSWEDINFGTYGGIIGAIISIWIYYLMK
jgi:hypothetical protein